MYKQKITFHTFAHTRSVSWTHKTHLFFIWTLSKLETLHSNQALKNWRFPSAFDSRTMFQSRPEFPPFLSFTIGKIQREQLIIVAWLKTKFLASKYSWIITNFPHNQYWCFLLSFLLWSNDFLQLQSLKVCTTNVHFLIALIRSLLL